MNSKHEPRSARSEASTPGRQARTRDVAGLGLWAELRDAVSVRTTLLVTAILLLQLGFILSYVGALHHPKPHRIPLAVVAPGPVADRTVAALNAIPGEPVQAVPVADEATARHRISEDTSAAALLVNPSGTTDTLLVASATGPAVASAVQQVVSRADATQARSVAMQDVVPLQSGDGRGLTGFYLAIGWVIGGYLVAALLGVTRGARPANIRRALIRLAVAALYAILSGLGGALIVGPVLDGLTGHLLPLWALGSLLVFAAATVSMALQGLFGVFGIGLTVLLFVVLGNPSAGGAFQRPLLPPFWRTVGPAIPNGAGTEAVRRIVYFHAYAITDPVLVIAGYALAGVVISAVAAVLLNRRDAGQPGWSNDAG